MEILNECGCNISRLTALKNIVKYFRGLFMSCMMLLAVQQHVAAQGFFNLTAREVRIDSLMPLFTYTQALGAHYADSVYTVKIEYPEFIDMTPTDTARLRTITTRQWPAMPQVSQYVGVARRQGTLYVSFVPIVQRDGRLQKLVSFKLTVEGHAKAQGYDGTGALGREVKRSRRQEASTQRYANQSVLSTGRWAKIRVPSTGVYELTEALIRKAGFSDVSKVKVYGYGGALQPEQLTADYLTATDDLKEVATCTVGGRRLFYAVGPVGWSSATQTTRTRNPYSQHGYYLLTENDSTALTVGEEEFKAAHYPAPYDYHTLYEVDDYAWYHGGRNLYDSRLFGTGVARSYQMEAPAGAKGQLTMVMTFDAPFAAEVAVNGTTVGTVSVASAIDRYSKGAVSTKTFALDDSLRTTNDVTIRQTSGGNIRLDYLSLCFDKPLPWANLAGGTFPVPEYVHNITNQNLHADTAADMVIIVPTSQELTAEAERLKAFHESHDSLRVRIVPADELFNEFSSGTPDANAYRRYLKMLYDRADSDADMPRYLLLFGDGAWDNRMLSAGWKGQSPDDYLICYESENSFSETECYVSDDYFCLMDDGEGAAILTTDKSDVAVGRFPVTTEEEAKVMVDKTINYVQNNHAGAWQNTLCFMGDDGDSNRHMADADSVASMVAQLHPAFNIKKIYWDAYPRQSSSTGFSYPDVTNLIVQQMKSGALIMNYSGHGAPYTLSHEQVVKLADFSAPTSQRLPLWLTASCDIMPFDGLEENIGETTILNKNGGAIAFYGTTRTVYAHYNRYMNLAYTKYVLGHDADGRQYTIGEAGRMAKNLLMTPTRDGNDIGVDQTANKLQFTLLGDPALRLAAPTMQMTVDSINGQPASGEVVRMLVGQPVTVTGHVVGGSGFNGVVTACVRDVETTVVCRENDDSTPSPFTFKNRLNTLYQGSDSVRNGRFTLRFALPKDIDYTGGTGLITLYALSNDRRQEAHGSNTNFTVAADTLPATDGIGPNIHCYLNASSFVNGGNVNTTPYFYAELTDKDGINVAGGGIGHDLELTVDGQMQRTYILNDFFQYDFGDYRSGSVGYSLPELTAGRHKLLFRAWDLMNNSSVAELEFNVVKGLQPTLFSIDCTKNPATTSTTFVINHDRVGSTVDVQIDVFDTSGRQLWQHTEQGVSSSQAYTVDWDLCTTGGHRLQTGVYLYRVRMSNDNGSQASLAKKLIILRNK